MLLSRARGNRPETPAVIGLQADALSAQSVDGDEDRLPHLAADGLRQVPLAVDVLDEDDFAGTDLARFAVARGDLHAGIEVDDVLAPRRRVPVEVVVGPRLVEDDPGTGNSNLFYPPWTTIAPAREAVNHAVPTPRR